MAAIEKIGDKHSDTIGPPDSDIEIGSVAVLEKPSQNGDEALQFLKNQHDVGELTPEEEKRLLRKIDWMIMPLMWSCYCLQYLDKTLGESLACSSVNCLLTPRLVNYAAVMGLYDDANITTSQFSNLALM